MNDKAFEERALACRPRLYRLAMHLTGSEADADDLMSATYEEAIRSRHGLRNAEATNAWLRKIMFNTFADQAKARARAIPVADVERDIAVAHGGRVPSAQLTGNLEGEILATGFTDQTMAALDALPASHRSAFMLHVLHGLSYEEIRDETGCALGTVKSRIARARAAMADALSGVAGRGPKRKAIS